MGFNKRRMDSERAAAAAKEAAELIGLTKSSVAEEYYAERSGNRWVSE